MPAHNAEASLREALLSACAQTHRDIEILVIDDGSTDSTAKIATEFVGADSRVQLHRRAKGGVSAAFNTGLAMARGDYVARLDADDLWHPDKIARQMEVALQQPETAFIYAFVRYVDEDGRVVRDAPPQHFPPHSLCRGLYESIVGGNSSALMKRSVVASLGGYEESLSSWEDLLLQLRISARHPIGFVPEYLVGYRVRPGSLSADPDNMLRSWLQARQQLMTLFPEIPRFVHDWAHGTRCGQLAESFAWRGRYGECASLLRRAFRHDPAWTWRFLAYRSSRAVKQRFRGQPKPSPRPQFLDCRPAEQVGLTDFDKDVEGKALRRLHERRVQALAELDQLIARANPGPLDAGDQGSCPPAPVRP